MLIKCSVLFNELLWAPPRDSEFGGPKGLGFTPVVTVKDVGACEFLVLCCLCLMGGWVDDG